ncbi:MAG: fibronectin type III domain-containing protein [Firmicutes bacterium]|nr:fibronectin type III domain-containing protein [Bacillota bacterium]
MKSYALAVGGMPPRALKYYLIEARKTQPDALYVFNINSFKGGEPFTELIHYTVDYLPVSQNKLELIKDLTGSIGLGLKDSLEYYMPFYRYHSIWPEVNEDPYGYNFDLNGLKSASYYGSYLNVTKPLSKANYFTTDKTVELSAMDQETLDDLLTYIEENNVHAVFQTVPQYATNESNVGMFNEAQRIIEERGFKVYDYFDALDEIGLDLGRDFYEERHLNVHGSLKFTHYSIGQLMTDLQENERFQRNLVEPDTRTDASWNQAYEDYIKVVSPYTLDFERDQATVKRDYSMIAPGFTLTAKNGDVAIEWQYHKNRKADGFCIYRKFINKTDPLAKITNWEKIAEVEQEPKGKHLYLDTGLNVRWRYAYTVVPYRIENGQKVYGNFQYAGKGLMIYDKSPMNITVEDHGEEGVVLTWDPVPDAVSYKVRRRLAGRYRWVQIATDLTEPTYTDLTTMLDSSYLYSVKVCYLRDGENQESYYAEPGVLLARNDLQAPTLSAAVSEDGKVLLAWDEIAAADYYRIYRYADGGHWQLVADNLTGTSYIDDTATKPTNYHYRVVVIIENGDDKIIDIKDKEKDVTVTIKTQRPDIHVEAEPESTEEVPEGTLEIDALDVEVPEEDTSAEEGDQE